MTTKAATRRGVRDGKKEAFWRGLIEGRNGSGLSVRAWCRRHRVRETSFYWWRRALARRDAETQAPESKRAPGARPATLVPVRLAAQTSEAVGWDGILRNGSAGGLEIVLPGARCIRVLGAVNRQALADVLEVLEDWVSRKRMVAETAAC